MAVEKGPGSAEWFSNANPDPDVKKYIARFLHAGAQEVLAEDADRIRSRFITRVSQRETLFDPLVHKYGASSCLVVGGAGFGIGKQFSYYSALIYYHEARSDASLQSTVKEKLDVFAEREKLEPEECEILRQLAYLARLISNQRRGVERRLKPRRDENGNVENVDDMFAAWEFIAKKATGK